MAASEKMPLLSMERDEEEYWKEQSRKNGIAHNAMMRRNMALAVSEGEKKLGSTLSAALDEEDTQWATKEKQEWITRGEGATWEVVNSQRQRWRAAMHRLYDKLREEQLARDSGPVLA